MIDLSNVIRYGNECILLDYKREQYKKKPDKAYADFLKDIIALANADTDLPCYIIIGITIIGNGEKILHGIDERLTEKSILQQLVNENIEPELMVDYFSYKLDGKIFGVIEIKERINKPYMMKKHYNKYLDKGDSFIRKGSINAKMLREDLDKIYENKKQDINFDEFIKFMLFVRLPYIDETTQLIIENDCKEINIPAMHDFVFENIDTSMNVENGQLIFKNSIYDSIPIQKINAAFNYEGNLDYNDSFLIKDFGKKIRRYYPTVNKQESREYLSIKEHLIYEESLKDRVWNLYSNVINIGINNISDRYIEDATLSFIIYRIPGLILVANSMCPIIDKKESLPEVIIDNEYYLIEQELGTLKHFLPAVGFAVRLLLHSNTCSEKIRCIIRLYGKNIKIPIKQEVTLIPIKLGADDIGA